MERREFIRNGIILFAAPAIIKIENLMRIGKTKEIIIVGEVISDYDLFMEKITRLIAREMNVPYDILIGKKVEAYRSIAIKDDMKSAVFTTHMLT